MPRSRGSDGAVPPHHRASPRAPLHLRSTTNSNNTATSADSNGTRPIRDRSPKLEEHRRSPRSPLPEVGVTTAQKKRATRVADLETRLGHAQDELRKLRDQLASAEAAKKDAQHELQETKKKKTSAVSATGSPASKNHCTQSDHNGTTCPVIASPKKVEKKKPEQGDEDNDKDLNVQEQVSKVADQEAAGEQPPAEVGCATDDTKGQGVNEHAGDDAVASSDVSTTADSTATKEEEQTVVKWQLEEEQAVVLVEKHGDNVDDQTTVVVALEGEEHAQAVATTTTTVVALEGEEHAQAVATTTTGPTATNTTELHEQLLLRPQSPDLTKKQPTSPAPEEEMLELETRLWKKDKELDLLRSDNASLKSQLAESTAQISSLTTKLSSLQSSLQDQRQAAETKLGEVESARAALEAEVKRLRVQTDQWRKAADAAAAIISGEDFDTTTGTLGGRRVAERCGSMDKYIGGGFDAAAVLGSPLMEADGDGAASGKRRGMRVFGDLWRKKGPNGGANNK